jgi:peroxiredoxin
MVTWRRLVVFLGLISLCVGQAPRMRKCPDTIIRTMDAKVVKVSQYRGKVVMIVMFLTYDQNSILTMQLANKLYAEYSGRGLQVVGASLNESSANLLPFQARYHFPFVMGHLEKEGAIQLAGLAKDTRPVVPLIMFVNKLGYVQSQYQGGDKIFDDAERNFRGIITSMLTP